MIRTGIYVVDPSMAFTWSSMFIETVCGRCYDALYHGVEFDEVLGGYVEDSSGEIVLNFHARCGYKNYKELLPHYVNGKLKELTNIVGFLVLLYAPILDFAKETEVHSYAKVVRREFNSFQQAAPDVPYVIVLVHKGDSEESLAVLSRSIRQELQISDAIKIIPCDIENKQETKQVLLELMDVVHEFPEKERYVDLIKTL